MTPWTTIPASLRDLVEHVALEAGIDLDGVETVAQALERLGPVAEHALIGDGASDPTIRESLGRWVAVDVPTFDDVAGAVACLVEAARDESATFSFDGDVFAVTHGMVHREWVPVCRVTRRLRAEYADDFFGPGSTLGRVAEIKERANHAVLDKFPD